MTTEPYYWTGATETRPCGCVFRELARTDGSKPSSWLGKSMCDKHLQWAQNKVRELVADGVIAR